MKILHHNDLDGRGSAYLIYKRYMNLLNEESFIEMSYNSGIPFDRIENNEIVYIVDFSFEPKEMRELLDITSNVIWIDHHDTAINKYKDFKFDLEGIRDKDKSGILLTYNYLYGNDDLKKSFFNTTGIPDFVKYINDWDTWTHKFDNTLNFRYGMYINETNPTNLVWGVARREPQKIIQDGAIINKYRSQWNKEYIDDFAFELDFEGYKTIALNLRKSSSLVFDSVDEDYEIKMLFAFNGDNFKVSIYTDKDYIHVGKLAEKYDGGGHPGAGGFYIDDIRKLKEG